MGDPMVERVCSAAGVPDLVERLAGGVSSGDLQAFLLELGRRRAARRAPKELLAQYLGDAAVRVDSADAREIARLTLAAFEAADGFEALELSPVEPLGAQAVLGGLSQDNVLSTVRASEVVADPTVPLALAAAVARRAGRDDVRLCGCMRVVRPAARAIGAPVERLDVRISDSAVHRALSDGGVAVRRDVEHPHEAMPVEAARRLGRRLRRLELAVDVLAPVVSGAPETTLLVDLTRSQGVGYYDGLQLRIDAVSDGIARELADGGAVDWSAQLLSDRRERLFTSGLGLERLLES